MLGRFFNRHRLTLGIRAAPERRSGAPAYPALRASALSLIVVFTLMAAACDAPDEASLAEDTAPVLPPAQMPTRAPAPGQIEVHRDTTRPPTSSPDRAVLVTFYHATDGPNWTNNTNWLSDAPLDTWHGVTTDHEGYVRHLQLGRNQLGGTIPPEIGRLARLEYLDLHVNQLSGTIPSELSRLSGLYVLWLGGNLLSGEIPPWLGQLSRLTYLSLDTNQLRGEIPVQLANLANLTYLILEKNQLSGRIPPSLGRLLNLERLSLHENHLHGAIPPELGGLPRLASLSLHDNQLRGAIPPELRNLSRLDVLSLGGSNHLTGCVPEELGAVPVGDIAALNLPYCDLNGRVPVSPGPTPTRAPAAALVADRAALVALYQATGGANWTSRDSWLSEAPIGEWHGVSTGPGGRVVELRLQDNRLAGEIPPEVGNLSSLELLALGGNQLRGPIPAELGNLTKLRVLSLHRNQLSQTIPAGLGGLTQLRWLDLYDNQLSGSIPPELGRLANLESLSLSENQLGGTIPSELGQLSRLESLGLDDNRLSGSIPAQLGNLPRLGILALDYNQLSGALPIELGRLSDLQHLWLAGSNRLTGCIAPALRTAKHHDLDNLKLPSCDSRIPRHPQ